jgi:hypothetical protein
LNKLPAADDLRSLAEMFANNHHAGPNAAARSLVERFNECAREVSKALTKRKWPLAAQWSDVAFWP